MVAWGRVVLLNTRELEGSQFAINYRRGKQNGSACVHCVCATSLPRPSEANREGGGGRVPKRLRAVTPKRTSGALRPSPEVGLTDIV